MRPTLFLSILFYSLIAHASLTMQPQQSLKTSGARAVKSYVIDGVRYLAVAQLSKDVPGTKANMNGGNSDVDVLIYKNQNGHFKLYQRIPGHGNEDLAIFAMGQQTYLATASIRSGTQAPYNLKSYSQLYRWDGKVFYPVQQFLGYATKGVTAFQIGQRWFLGFANGVLLPNQPHKEDTRSTLYTWNGHAFELLQRFNTKWAYGFDAFEVHGTHYLALADHAGASVIYRWNGKTFTPFQSFSETGGRAFTHFKIKNDVYLAYANLTHDPQIFKWNGKRFTPFQTLEGKGSRQFEYFKMNGQSYLFRVNFITGGKDKPNPVQKSVLYQWTSHQFKPIIAVNTTGAVDADFFKLGNSYRLAVTNSLNAALRFSDRTQIYSLKE